MRKIPLHSALVVALLCGLVLPGCGGDVNVIPPVETAAQRKKVAGDAGEAAALAYLVIQKPTKEQALAIKVVADKLVATLKDYKQGGFKATREEVHEGLALALPGDDRKAELLLATKLADTLIDELDRLFDEHPQWKDLNKEVTDLVSSFATGASKALDAYSK